MIEHLICRHTCIQTLIVGLQLFGFFTAGPTVAFGQEEGQTSFIKNLIEAAIERTHHHVTYDGRYHAIPYSMGDIPDDVGVCTDVVIRSVRSVGIDFQRLVHEDLQSHFSAYPNFWGLHKPHPNIDHRRVPNLQAFLTRNGTVLPITLDESARATGDLVTWTVANHLPTIGIVTDHLVPGTKRPMIVHNIGKGPTLEEMLLSFSITGHYRYGQNQTMRASALAQ